MPRTSGAKDKKKRSRKNYHLVNPVLGQIDKLKIDPHTRNNMKAKLLGYAELVDDGKDEYKEKIYELIRQAGKLCKAGGWPTVINNVLSNPIDLETNVLSKFDEDALPYLLFLRTLTKDANWNEPVDENIGDGYKIHIFKKENGIYSGHLMDKNSNIMMEFRDQTLPILASMIATKIGGESNTDEYGKDYEEMESQEVEVIEDYPVEEQEVFNSEDMEVAEPMQNPKKTSINIDKEGNISIEIMKSIKESKMNIRQMLSELYDELKKSNADDEGHEYIKTTKHNGGVQHWYKDPETGKIIEKEKAPNDEKNKDLEELVGVINDLADKVNQIEEEHNQLMEEPKKPDEAPLSEDEEKELAENLKEGENNEDETPKIAQKLEEKKEELDQKDEEIKEEDEEKVRNDDEVVKTPKNSYKKDVNEEVEADKPSSNIEEKMEEGEESEVEAKESPEEAKEEVEHAAEELAAHANEDQASKIIAKLKEKFPNLSKAQEDKIIEYINKGKVRGIPDGTGPYGAGRGPGEGKADGAGLEEQKDKKSCGMKHKAEMDETPAKEDEEELKKKQGVPEGVDPAKHERCVKEVKKQGKDKESAIRICNASMKKSRLQRMWKVFNINMPESLEKEEDINLAKSGARILMDKVMNQGKDLEKATDIAIKTMEEKYGEDFAKCGDMIEYFSKNPEKLEKKKEVKKSSYSVKEREIEDYKEMLKAKEQDAEDRFNIKEYEGNEIKGTDLVKMAKSDVNEKIEKMIKGEKPDFSEFKEFNPENLKKSTEEYEIEKLNKATAERNWNVPEWKDPSNDTSISKEIVSDINESIKKSLQPKPKDIDWGEEFKPFVEEEVKKSMNKEETESEKFNKSKQVDFWTKEDEKLEKASEAKFEVDEKNDDKEEKKKVDEGCKEYKERKAKRKEDDVVENVPECVEGELEENIIESGEEK